MAIDVELDTRQADATIRRLTSYLSPQVVAREASRALNRGAKAGATTMNKEIRKTINLRAGDVRDRIEVKRATPGNLNADIVVDRKPLPLAAFRPRETRKGLRVRILKRGSLKTIERAFLVAQWGNKPIQRAGAERYPLRMLWGPSVGSQSAEAWKTAEERAREVIGQRFIRGINRQVERANR